MAAPFSISKLLGVGILIVALIYISLPMIQQAFTPSVAYNASTTNAVAYATNVTCDASSQNALLNNSNQYLRAQCLIQTMFGPNASYSTSPNSQYGRIFNQSTMTSFGTNSTNSNSTSQTGFFVNIFQFTGLSFVFSGIGTIIKIFQTLGQITSLLFQALFSWLPPFESIVIVNMLKLVVFYVYVRIMLLGISAWMKFSLIDS